MARFVTAMLVAVVALLLAALPAAALLAPVADRKPVEWTSNGVKHVGRISELSHGLADCYGGTQYSGYFDISAKTDKHYFFWLFEAEQNPQTAPLISWFTGGPGCASSLALMVENGPCHVNMTTGELYKNPYGWTKAGHLLYVDQPAGVGFSYADQSGYDHNETMVAEDMFHFYQAFYAAFPQLQSNPLNIVGESYGGHYAPAVAYRVHLGNVNKEGIHVPLSGLSMGNGMTQPDIQFAHYAPLAYQWCNTVKGAPCISESQYNQQMSELPSCIALAKSCTYNNTNCALAMEICSQTQMAPFEQSGLNVYDIRIPCQVPGLCYDFSKVTAFLNRADIQKQLGVKSTKWQSCNMEVNQMFTRDWMRGFSPFVSRLVEAGIRVMVYAGKDDFICNWLGNKAWVLAMDSKFKTQFNAALDLQWYGKNMKPGGQARTISGLGKKMLLSFVTIEDAGHMVPLNQPENALTMIKNFVDDTPFRGYAGPQ